MYNIRAWEEIMEHVSHVGCRASCYSHQLFISVFVFSPLSLFFPYLFLFHFNFSVWPEPQTFTSSSSATSRWQSHFAYTLIPCIISLLIPPLVSPHSLFTSLFTLLHLNFLFCLHFSLNLFISFSLIPFLSSAAPLSSSINPPVISLLFWFL